MRLTRLDLGIAVALAAGTMLAFGPAFGATFIALDDPTYVESNCHVLTGLTAKNIIWAWTTFDAANWHPLTWLSLQMDAVLWGTNPAGFHATNIILHAANAVLLFLAVRALTDATLRSACVAALFAVHPLRVESVVWISERKDVLSIFFGFLALWAYAAYAASPSVQRYLAIAVALVLSLLSKPMLVTLPCLLLVLDWWPLNRAGSFSAWRWLIVEKLPLLTLCLASCVVTFIAQHQAGAVTSLLILPMYQRSLNVIVAYASYLGLMIWPLHLAPLYLYPPNGWPDSQVAVSVLTMAVLTGLTIWQRRKMPYLLAGWLWYLGTLIPVIGLIQVGSQAYADRYTYFPIIGVTLAIVWGGADALARTRPMTALVTVTLTLVWLSVLTWFQTGYWRNDLTLWPHTLAITGPNALAHSNYGTALEDQTGQLTEAIKHYIEAIKISPNYGTAHFNLAKALDKQGRTAEAIYHYQETVRTVVVHSDPILAKAHNNLGVALGENGANAEAMEHYREALRIDPELAVAHRNLGAVLERQGRDQEAIEHYRAMIRIDPNDGVGHSRLGVVLAKRGDLYNAVEHLRQAAKLRPDSAAAQANLGVALKKIDQESEAVACFRRAVELDPKDLHNRIRLAAILARQKQTDAAEAQYQESLRLNTDWPAEFRRKAWLLATCSNPSSRNGEIAVEMAENACHISNPPSALFLDALAAAYAEAGRFSEAVATAERALASAIAAHEAEQARAVSARLALYRQHRPFHESKTLEHP